MLLFLEQCLNGLQFGLLLFLLAAGLTLVFGIMDLVNLAHGSLYMVGAYFASTFVAWTGSFVPSRTGNTNICSGMSAWKRFDSMKSISSRAAAGCALPFSTPANSTCRKHESSIVPMGDVFGCGFVKYTAAGGLDADDTRSELQQFP